MNILHRIANWLRNDLTRANVVGYSDHHLNSNFFERQFYVTHKEAVEDLDPRDVIPKWVLTWTGPKKTDVLPIGEVTASAQKARPLVGGVQIQASGRNAVGTLGGFMYLDHLKGRPLLGITAGFKRILDHFRQKGRDIPEEEELVGVTNSHVVNPDVTDPEELEVGQPYSRDSDLIGRVFYSHPIRGDGSDRVDLSLIELNKDVAPNEPAQSVKDCQKGTKVDKIGRTTGYTQGTCIAKNATIRIRYSDSQVFTFKGLDVFSRMSSGGDSGSFIYDEDGNLCSHLFAGSDRTTIGYPASILLKLGLEVEG